MLYYYGVDYTEQKVKTLTTVLLWENANILLSTQGSYLLQKVVKLCALFHYCGLFLCDEGW